MSLLETVGVRYALAVLVLREPAGTGLLTDVLQFNPTCFNHKGIVGLIATRELSLTSSSDPSTPSGCFCA